MLGRNGNGKTTLARLLAAQLTPMDGEMTVPGKMGAGYFTQYQVENPGDENPGDSAFNRHRSRLR